MPYIYYGRITKIVKEPKPNRSMVKNNHPYKYLLQIFFVARDRFPWRWRFKTNGLEQHCLGTVSNNYL